jgi:hypothetical protein
VPNKFPFKDELMEMAKKQKEQVRIQSIILEKINLKLISHILLRILRIRKNKRLKEGV